MERSEPKLIAFYLPQYHPIPENDQWWGKGFTEWTNVTKAAPLFPGHYQPHLPADLGFYDLRVREVMRDQAELARKFGIDGFCYYYYWFSGTRLLDRPIDSMLADKSIDMPFCLCWANENWTRRWDAADHEILIEQKYLPDDDIEFIESIVPFFKDERYIRINSAPLLMVYKPQDMPDAKKTVERWRAYCRDNGIGEVHLCAALTNGNLSYEQFGFDSGVEHPPHNWDVPIQNEKVKTYHPFTGYILRYEDVAKNFLQRAYNGGSVFKTVVPSWDNTARANDRALVMVGGTPGNYEHWLSEAIKRTEENASLADKIVFINAWNEWAEGCHLEPDQKNGLEFLQSTLVAKEGNSVLTDFPDETRFNDYKDAQRRTLHTDLAEVFRFHCYAMIATIKSEMRKRPVLRKIGVWVRRYAKY